MLIKIYLILFFFLQINLLALARESCSRIATINFQDVLVDSSSSVKGEGLRIYLEKDSIAKQYLETYQHNSKPSLKGAITSTIGASLTLAGLMTDSDKKNGLFSKQTMIGSGLTLIILNYLISRTNAYTNEGNLINSIDEYNKRNSPKIYFSPTTSSSGNSTFFGINLAYIKEF